jgi:hypothetical protein
MNQVRSKVIDAYKEIMKMQIWLISVLISGWYRAFESGGFVCKIF